jgi:hypothetical protein
VESTLVDAVGSWNYLVKGLYIQQDSSRMSPAGWLPPAPPPAPAPRIGGSEPAGQRRQRHSAQHLGWHLDSSATAAMAASAVYLVRFLHETVVKFRGDPMTPP